MFYLSKNIWSLRLAQSIFKIIRVKVTANVYSYFTHDEFTLNIQNVQNMQKQENSRERTNLTIKDHGIWKVKKATSPILNWL